MIICCKMLAVKLLALAVGCKMLAAKLLALTVGCKMLAVKLLALTVGDCGFIWSNKEILLINLPCQY